MKYNRDHTKCLRGFYDVNQELIFRYLPLGKYGKRQAPILKSKIMPQLSKILRQSWNKSCVTCGRLRNVRDHDRICQLELSDLSDW